MLLHYGRIVSVFKSQYKGYCMIWDKSPQASVLKAVAKEVLKEKIKNPKVRQAIMNKISHRLERSLLRGTQLPNVLMYDKNAKPKGQDKNTQ
jgi:hypothetical protein